MQPRPAQHCCCYGQNVTLKSSKPHKQDLRKREPVIAGVYNMGITTRADEKNHVERLAVLYEWMSLFTAVKPLRCGDPLHQAAGGVIESPA